MQSTVSPSISVLAGFATFITVTLAGTELYTAEAFAIFSVFNAMQFSIGTLPWAIKAQFTAKTSIYISLKRVSF